MLQELHIRNVAIIDEIGVEFCPGLNILTGETGAGKSIIIGALGLILGEKTDVSVIRTGEDSAYVEAMFDLSKEDGIRKKIEELGIDMSDGEMIIKRTIFCSGKGRSYINGNMITLSILREIGNSLVDIHGQHDHQRLLHPENHVWLLDSYAGITHLRKKFSEMFISLQDMTKELEKLVRKERESIQREDLILFQITEIDNANLLPEKEEGLKRERDILLNAERLYSVTRKGYDLLYSSEGSIIERLNEVIKDITGIVEIDNSLKISVEEGRSAIFQLEDIASGLRDYSENIEADPERLGQIEDRLSETDRLKRKYGQSIKEILDFRKKIETELQDISHSAERNKKLQSGIKDIKERLKDLAIKLTRKREDAAKRLQSDIVRELHELNMAGVIFRVNFTYETDEKGFVEYEGKMVRLNPYGIGSIEFRFSPNPGEEEKSLSKIASGGELSRVMLAIKNILSKLDNVPTLIFDEVDSGIGGQVADMVGIKLKNISKARQVFCITHLPGIASRAETHFRIEKEIVNKRTQTKIKKLNIDERIEEIARMLGGKAITKTTREHAREILMKNENIKIQSAKNERKESYAQNQPIKVSTDHQAAQRG
ncbi:MAG: DNA repair protein RecN [Nitrospinota bacterium]